MASYPKHAVHPPCPVAVMLGKERQEGRRSSKEGASRRQNEGGKTCMLLLSRGRHAAPLLHVCLIYSAGPINLAPVARLMPQLGSGGLRRGAGTMAAREEAAQQTNV